MDTLLTSLYVPLKADGERHVYERMLAQYPDVGQMSTEERAATKKSISNLFGPSGRLNPDRKNNWTAPEDRRLTNLYKEASTEPGTLDFKEWSFKESRQGVGKDVSWKGCPRTP